MLSEFGFYQIRFRLDWTTAELSPQADSVNSQPSTAAHSANEANSSYCFNQKKADCVTFYGICHHNME